MNNINQNQINPKDLEYNSGQGYLTAPLDKLVGLARSKSLWPLPFATSCCGIEFMSTMSSTYDLARFGAERIGFTPRQCDVLLVAGTIAKKMGPILKKVYIQMAEPRWVVAIGACASSGGIFDTYSVLQGIDKIIPVDVYVPGCPPRPEGIIEGLMKVQELVKNEPLRRRSSAEYKQLLESYGIDTKV
ncbi:MAG: NADH-quinone oxidoreductase subunit B [Solitalea-like symbiont of Tyrophagus putrescentiae]